MWYRIQDGKLIDYANYKYDDGCLYTEIVTKEDIDSEPNMIIIVDNNIQLNPNYQQEQEEKEKERISKLKCTKRVLVMMLEELGIDYFSDIVPLIDLNRQAKLEWELCVELERSNPLIDIIGLQLGINSKQIDALFKYANGEIDKLEVING